MSIATANFAYLRRLLAESAAMALSEDKHYLVEARLGPLVRRAAATSVDQLIERLRAAPDGPLRQCVVDAMTTNETSFFRDGVPFQTLRDVILPDLVARRARRRNLNVWSAGCSSGQEIYSLAILLHEHFPECADWRFWLLASDVSAQVLQRAETAHFTSWEVERGMPIALREKYFHVQGQGWQLNESVRRMVHFRQFSLHAPWPSLPRVDLVMLRNVLVYFDVATTQTVLSRIRGVMAADGYLLLGGAETPVHIDAELKAVRGNGFSYYQLGKS